MGDSGFIGQGFGEADHRLQAQVEFGVQHGLDFVAKARKPGTGLDPGVGVVAADDGKRLSMLHVELGEALLQQGRDFGNRRQFEGREGFFHHFVEGGQLAHGRGGPGQGFSHLGAQYAEALFELA